MRSRASKKPTEAELEILSVLWRRGPSTVRSIQEELDALRPTGYTTVLKTLQIMTEKGTVRRNEEQRAHVYEANEPAADTKRRLAGDVLQRVFDGSASELMMHVLSGKGASAEELDEIRQMIDEYEKSGR